LALINNIAMDTTTHQQMHRDHSNWLKEHDLWRDDIRAWQGELRQAIGQIDELRALLNDHEERLQRHAASIRAYEQIARQHEHVLSEHEQDETDGELLPLAARHSEETAHQAQQRTKHEWLKRSHHTVMATWTILLKALRERA
jgi:chromosome segregation ATPase